MQRTGSKLFFFHLPKTAGTSIISALMGRSCRQHRSPNIENNTEDHKRLGGNYDIYRGYDIYAGHYGRDVFNAVEEGHFYFSSFRNPVARISSLYRYFNRIPMSDADLARPCHRVVALAKSLSFEDWILSEDEHIRLYTENVHARQLSNSLYTFSEAIDLEEIKRFIDGMAVVFVVEHARVSSECMHKILGIKDLQHLNVDSKKFNELDDISFHIIDKIREKNYMDQILYEYALRTLEERGIITSKHSS